MELSDFTTLTLIQDTVTYELTFDEPTQVGTSPPIAYSNNNIIGNQTNFNFNQTSLISYT